MTMSVEFVKYISMAHVQRVNIQEMTAVCSLANVVTISMSIALWSGSSKIRQRVNVRCADKNSNGQTTPL